VRAILYFVLLMYCFIGVAIIAEVFMAAIEKITSKKVSRWDSSIKGYRTMTVWNPTVANLSLMALGSSAPEIILNVIGIFPDFTSSELGPSTIVGSAAFNLLCILAVCVVSIPAGEYRKIKMMGVYTVTAVFSVFAYVWLIIILVGITPNVVEVWEGVLTFLFFWVLLVLAWMADKGMLPMCEAPDNGFRVHKEMTKEELSRMEATVREKYGKDVDLAPEQIAALIDFEFHDPHSRAARRCGASRALFGGKKIKGARASLSNAGWECGHKLTRSLNEQRASGSKASKELSAPIVTFKSLNYCVLESVGTVHIAVTCSGPLDKPIVVHYAPRDGSAKADSDYCLKPDTLHFSEEQREQTVPVEIKHSKGVFEETEEFYVTLSKPENTDDCDYDLAEENCCTVYIIDEDRPGVLRYARDKIKVEASPEVVDLPIEVVRKGGSVGDLSFRIRTENDSAIAGCDFEPIDTRLEMKEKCESVKTSVRIMASSKYEGEEQFRVILEDVEGGAKLDSTTDGGENSCICTVTIGANQKRKSLIDGLAAKVGNADSLMLGSRDFKEQFITAIYVNGSPDEQKEATKTEWLAHIVAVPWKVLFACVPPTEFCGGWLCFFSALIMIGMVTIVIGDAAELLGCVLGVPAGVTAITLVAVGTSVPDTFASRTAAQADPYADNSIGNVTGSNSVNVFLGLGLPWMIQAIYWQFVAKCEPGDSWSLLYPVQAQGNPTGAFVVQAGALSTTVMTFTACAVVCLSVLYARRRMLGGELGGDKPLAYATAGFFVTLWVIYLVVSIVLGDS